MGFFRREENLISQTGTFSEKSLIKAAAAGDSKAFARLLSLYERRVRGLGKRFFKNESDCDDFVQDVFIKVYNGLSSFRGEAQFSTWLMRIAYNTAINAVNRKKESVPLPEDYEILDPGEGPEEQHLRAITAQVIRDAIKELPERFGTCLDLYFFCDMSYNEISKITELPVNTIKSHVFRAKKLLKERLESEIIN